jgi:hypothetical protein
MCLLLQRTFFILPKSHCDILDATGRMVSSVDLTPCFGTKCLTLILLGWLRQCYDLLTRSSADDGWMRYAEAPLGDCSCVHRYRTDAHMRRLIESDMCSMSCSLRYP